ncbi:hypothetical protein T265_05150 [Opisthorchis viverrini]|uniref:Uncharacterized protein n=1 Tax=Opisthorchis viverrini TaxID=6198 RepID=A0A074ZLI6_OPIVI|nr:hypothetical protein T265_05150 [Opisthorchis viverrini]KER27951.1 hypothetical protein T265_05150 [Opisthorchis viverrini]
MTFKSRFLLAPPLVPLVTARLTFLSCVLDGGSPDTGEVTPFESRPGPGGRGEVSAVAGLVWGELTDPADDGWPEGEGLRIADDVAFGLPLSLDMLTVNGLVTRRSKLASTGTGAGQQQIPQAGESADITLKQDWMAYPSGIARDQDEGFGSEFKQKFFHAVRQLTVDARRRNTLLIRSLKTLRQSATGFALLGAHQLSRYVETDNAKFPVAFKGLKYAVEQDWENKLGYRSKYYSR